ncbi:OstA-like protein [Sphingobacterium luzhongxinii]|uniref:OstA-like protein n=1 Tax=Sphingobacterium luzhongxinii TaxID=2654181 RepID=UPI001F08DD55|nr:OstA-like protein [Sphingobacterium sp. xlx-73]
MRNWLLTLTFILTIASAFGQTPIGGTKTQQEGNDRLNLVSSNSGRINAKTGHMVFYIPVYEHKGNTLSADSGYIYEDEIKRQFFEAFGNVVITQPSGTVIYSDYLHYDAAAQHALLTGNVKMVDKGSTLTTNHLTYNMRSKVGTYTGGGRIISQGDTITSKNAYYFELTSDAYFRHKVVVRSQNVKVYTDTMRYNSQSKMTYFFGPTNIKPVSSQKGNNENLYTERGTYNTGTGIADFNKNNLYTEGSKFLKGDSLHYERAKGVGEAFRNVVFVDTTDKFYAFGGQGLYTQSEESIRMTDKPYIITVVKEDSPTPESDSTATSTEPKVVEKEKTTKESKKEAKTEISNTEEKGNKNTELPPVRSVRDSSTRESKMDSVYMTADTLFSQMILVKDYKPLELNLSRDGGKMEVDEEIDYGDENDGVSDSTLTNQKDSVQSDIENTLKPIVEKEIASSKPLIKKDTVKTTAPAKNKPAQGIPNRIGDRQNIGSTLKADSVLRQKAVVPIANQADTLINNALRIAQSPDTVINKTDSLPKAQSDTAKTRIVRAYYNVRLFKSDLQAVADSVYYGMQDSMFRFMGRPMIWSQGSQISADTIFMQIVNQQLDNALLKDNAFMVNAVLDSVKFNQLKGRKITAFFANNSIDQLFVDGNAENLVFSENDKTKTITEMFHDRGGRIKVKMENKKLIDYKTIHKVDQKVYPFKLVTQENEILPGFIWRPQDRPTSKEDLLNRKRELPKAEEGKEEDTKGKEKSKERIKEDLEDVPEKEESKKEGN